MMRFIAVSLLVGVVLALPKFKDIDADAAPWARKALVMPETVGKSQVANRRAGAKDVELLQECTDDADCSTGYTCVDYETCLQVPNTDGSYGWTVEENEEGWCTADAVDYTCQTTDSTLVDFCNPDLNNECNSDNICICTEDAGCPTTGWENCCDDFCWPDAASDCSEDDDCNFNTGNADFGCDMCSGLCWLDPCGEFDPENLCEPMEDGCEQDRCEWGATLTADQLVDIYVVADWLTNCDEFADAEDGDTATCKGTDAEFEAFETACADSGGNQCSYTIKAESDGEKLTLNAWSCDVNSCEEQLEEDWTELLEPYVDELEVEFTCPASVATPMLTLLFAALAVVVSTQ